MLCAGLGSHATREQLEQAAAAGDEAEAAAASHFMHSPSGRDHVLELAQMLRQDMVRRPH